MIIKHHKTIETLHIKMPQANTYRVNERKIKRTQEKRLIDPRLTVKVTLVNPKQYAHTELSI